MLVKADKQFQVLNEHNLAQVIDQLLELSFNKSSLNLKNTSLIDFTEFEDNLVKVLPKSAPKTKEILYVFHKVYQHRISTDLMMSSLSQVIT